MRRLLMILLLLLPTMLHGQGPRENDEIYSKFFGELQHAKKARITFVVRTSNENLRRYAPGDLKEMNELLGQYAHGQTTIGVIGGSYLGLGEIIQKDSAWIRMFGKLELTIQENLITSERFSKMKNVKSISDDEYHSYFADPKKFDSNWVHFHKHYGPGATLVEISMIASDEKHALFYFDNTCGGLCGNGGIVLFGKENGQWTFMKYLQLWQS